MSDRTFKAGALVPWALAIAGSVAAVGIAAALDSHEGALARTDFEHLAASGFDRLEQEVDEEIDAVTAVAAFFSSSTEVTRREFNTFCTSLLMRHSGMQALEWIPRVRDSERADYEARARGSGLAGFQFTERSRSNGMIRAAARPEYFPVFYLEPLAGNERALGFDLASSAPRKKALLQAARSGRVVISGRITLVQERGSSFAFLSFCPIYEPGASLRTGEERLSALTGFALGVNRVAPLVEEALPAGLYRTESLRVRIEDVSETGQRELLYGDSADESPYGIEAVSSTFIVGGRTWEVTVFKAAYRAPTLLWWVILLGGIGISCLTGIYVWGLNSRRSEAERISRELKERQTSLVEATRRGGEGLESLLEAVAGALKAGRVSAWRYLEGGTRLECLDTYTVDKNEHEHGYVLDLEQFPRWSAAIGSNLVLSVEDAQRDPRTSELAEEFLIPLSIGAMLEVGVQIRGEAAGLLCIQHLGGTRLWQPEEETYANAVANLLALQIETKALEAASYELRQFVDTANAPIFGVDRDGRVNEWNETAAAVTGFSKAEVLGQDFVQTRIREEHREAVREILERGLAGEATANYELPLQTKDDRRLLILFNATPRRDAASAVIGVWGVGQDITEIDAYRQELEIRVKERTAELVKTADQLTHSNQELARFAYVASHDLQEPLRAIASFSRLLERRYKGQLDAKADQYIGFVVDGALRMQALITGLLEFSRVESQGKPLARVALSECVSLALENLGDALAEGDAEVTVDPLPPVLGDSQQLSRLFQNLISNALKFCERDQPKVHISATRSGDVWTIVVSDNGIGIEPQDLARIFEPFTRLHPRSRFPGTGIGLSVCQRIALRHQGTLLAESSPGEGTRFKLTLPAIPEGEETPPPSPASASE